MTLLDPKILARLGNTQLRARAVVEGILNGLHRSPHQGQSVEFAEHKDYAPGDDLRHLDWKAWGKLDRYYVKRFEQETNLRAFLVIDASASMGYGGPDRLTKLAYAQTLAASLGYLLVRQQDAVGVVVARGRELGYLPPRAALGHLPAILGTLEGAAAAGPTDLVAAADLVAEKAGRRATVLVFSDLFDFSPGAMRRLADLRRMRHEVAIFQLLDPDELEFPFEDATRFEGLEGEEAIEVDPRAIRASYLEELATFCGEAKRTCERADVEYEQVRTDTPLDRLLLRFLARRVGGRR